MLLDNDKAFTVLLIATALAAAVWIALKVKTARRRPRIHPRLQKYAGPQADLARQRREEAVKIVATSSSSSIAGYRIIQHLETICVDGFRRSEEALEGLKAVAAMKGANAVINIRQQQADRRNISASGDAVMVEKTEEDERPG